MPGDAAPSALSAELLEILTAIEGDVPSPQLFDFLFDLLLMCAQDDSGAGAPDIFQVLRAWGFAAGHAEDLENHRELLKDTVVWNIEQGLELSALDVSLAQRERAALFQRVQDFFESYDYLVLPAAQT